MKPFWIRALAALPLGDTTILFEDGKATVRRGKVHQRLLSDLTDLARSTGVQLACIHASSTPTRVRLRFVGISGSLRQQFRNVWILNSR